MDPIEQAIKIAIEATGAAGVADLEAHARSLKQQIDALAASMKASQHASQADIQALADLVRQYDAATAAAKKANQVLKPLTSDLNITGRAALQLGYAVDDLQYGFSAIVNNAPGIAMALGGGPGIAGAMGIAFVAANVLIKAVAGQEGLDGAFKTAARSANLLSDPLKDATRSLEGLKSQFDAIQDKPFKVEVDYASMRSLQRELDHSNRLLREFDSLKGRDSKKKGEAKDLIAKGIVEGGGSENFEDALVEIARKNGTYGAGSELHGKIAAQQDVVDYYKPILDNPMLANSPLGMAGNLRTAQATAEIARLRDEMEKEQRAKVADMVGLKQGEGSRKALQDILLDPTNAAILRKHGITSEAARGVVAADPENLRADAENRRAAKEQEDRVRKEKQTRDKADREQADQMKHDQQMEAERQRKDAEVDAIVQETEIWTGHSALKGQADDAKAAAAARKQEADLRRKAQSGRDPYRQAIFGQQFQQQTGANDAQARQAGAMMAGMVDKGATPQQAMAATYKALLAQMQRMGQINLEQQAMLLEAQGFAEEASRVIGQINAKVQGQARNNRRAGSQMFSLWPNFN